MPPQYRPLQIPTKLQAPPPGAFDEQALTFDDAQKQQAALLAQKLNNESLGISVGERQRVVDEQTQLREALRTKFGDNQDLNPDEALQIAQKLALQSGNLDSALAIEKAQRDRRDGDTPLTPQQRELFQSEIGVQIPEGATLKDVTTLSSLTRAGAYNDMVHDPRLARNRDLNAVLMDQRANGTQVRPLTSSQEDEVAALGEVADLSKNILGTYLPHISENRATRWAEAKANPNSAIARMDQELVQLVYALSAARNGKRISDADYRFMAPLVKPGALDTIGTVEDKIKRVVEFAGIRKMNLFDTLGKSRRNIDNFRGGSSQNPDDLAHSLAGNPGGMDEETAYKEQYKAKLRAQRGG